MHIPKMQPKTPCEPLLTHRGESMGNREIPANAQVIHGGGGNALPKINAVYLLWIADPLRDRQSLAFLTIFVLALTCSVWVVSSYTQLSKLFRSVCIFTPMMV